MSELTDLEVCKRIAEIEGIRVDTNIYGKDEKCSMIDFPESDGRGGGGYPTYNPLTDDALCFQLMIKYKVICVWLWDEINGTPHYDASICNGNLDAECFQSKNPNKAICLAIIEANKS